MSHDFPSRSPAEARPDRASRNLEPYLAPVYSLCYRLLNDPIAAEDATQETFLDAIKIWDRFVPPTTAASNADSAPRPKDPRLQWLLAIAARRALSARRAAARFTPLPEPAMEPAHEQTPGSAAEQAETARRLDAALRELPAEEREAIMLHHVAGLTQAEIAQTLALPARTVSHRISDGLAALRERLERAEPRSVGATARPAGTAGLASMGALLIALPPLPAPAGLAAKLLSHPEILAWSTSSTFATASTATAGAAGAAPVSAASPVGAAASTVTTKGASIMSSKLMLAASAAVLAAAFAAWGSGAMDPAPRSVPAEHPVALTPHVPATESVVTRMPLTPVTPVAEGPVDPAVALETPAVSGEPKLTPEQLEAGYVKNLTGEQAAARAALAKAFSGKLPATGGSLPNGMTSSHLSFVNTSVGNFSLLHLSGKSGTADYLRLEPAWDGVVPPFAWNNFRVDTASACEQDAGLLSRTSKVQQVTSCGRQLQALNAEGALKINTDSAAQRLSVTDLWPIGRPARYDVKSVLDRVGLALVEQDSLATLLANAEKADRAFVMAALAWEQAKAGGDKTALAKAGAAGWQASQALTTAQWDVCKALEKYLQETQSGPTAWAILNVSGTETTNGFSLPMVQVQAAGQSTATTTTDTKPAALKMSTNRIYKLESGGETLAHLAQVINQNPASSGTVAIDPAVAKLTIDGTASGTTLEAVLTDLAKLANVDCQADGANRWMLVPKPVPTVGDGF